jgi:hypothetical protein
MVAHRRDWQGKEQSRAAEGAPDGPRAERLKEYADEQTRQKVHQAAEELSRLSAAVRNAADTLRDDGDARIAGYAEALADRLEHTGRYVQDRSIRDLLADAGEVARRHPELVMGGLFLAGLAAGRFLKASDGGSISHGGKQDWETGWESPERATEGMTEFPAEAESQAAPSDPQASHRSEP